MKAIKQIENDALEYAESIIDTVREPLIVLDQNLRVVKVSRSFYETFKVKPEDTMGQLIYDLGNKQWDIPGLRDLLETILPQETTFDSYEVEHDFATIGRRIMLLNARQIHRGLGKERIILLAIEDITDRKRLEEEQQRVSKLESVGLLAGGIAHDFNNILTSILGNISLARTESHPGSELHEILEQAEKASLRAKALTVKLLTFSKGGAPVKKLVSLTNMLKDTAGFALANSNVECRFAIPADLWQAEIDSDQVSQAVQNLVVNAQQSMPTGGTIELTAENMTISEAQSLGRGLPIPEGNYIRIAVTDHGCGICGEHLDKVFDPFFSTKKKGSGLGLATSFSIARQHGGHISVESEAGSGSTFYLYLPASTEGTIIKRTTKEQARPPGKARILVMDDEQGVRAVIGRMLKYIGYTDIEFAADGAEAVKLYKTAMESGNPFSVAILDLSIPGGMGGQVTVRKLLKLDHAVKAIVSSGYADDPVIARYREYGFSAMLIKPYTIDELGKAVQCVIAQVG